MREKFLQNGIGESPSSLSRFCPMLPSIWQSFFSYSCFRRLSPLFPVPASTERSTSFKNLPSPSKGDNSTIYMLPVAETSHHSIPLWIYCGVKFRLRMKIYVVIYNNTRSLSICCYIVLLRNISAIIIHLGI